MNQIKTIIKKQQQFFYSGQTKSVSYRKKQLIKLKQAIKTHESEIIQTLKQDLNKSEYEAYSTEIGMVYEEINVTLKHLDRWVKRKKVKTPLTHIGSKSYIYQEPYGVVLILAPWNYPFQLQLAPLIGAIAAGNCAVLKPSELTPSVSSIVNQIISEAFDSSFVTTIEGGIEISEALLEEAFDYIFFTGSTRVGKLVMEAASKHLTPVTLELGGKSPVIVEKDANLPLAAKRIAWGKFTNAGQTCVAPDYVYVHESIKEPFLEALKQAICELYGAKPLLNPNYGRIVSEHHFHRLVSFLENGQIVLGGETNEQTLQISPTILDHLSWNDPVMAEEIFGPILPVLSFSSVDEVIKIVQSKPKPLALYFFSESKASQSRIIRDCSFGGGCINDTLFHLANPFLPFGGVGSSGMGSYHGKQSFLTFSHEKSVLKQTTAFDLFFRYPNYKNGLALIKKFLK